MVKRVRGAFAIAVTSSTEPGVIVGARSGSPLVLGIGFDEHYLASDVHPLLTVTNRFVYLEEGDVVRLDTDHYEIRNQADELVERPVKEADLAADATQRGDTATTCKKRFLSSLRPLRKRSRAGSGLTMFCPISLEWEPIRSWDR